MKWYIYVMVAVMAIGLVSAASIDDTLITITGINTTINITEPWTFNNLTVYNHSLVVVSMNQSNADGFFSWNFTQSHQRLFGTDFPYVSQSTSTTKTITSNLTQAINATLIVSVESCNSVYSVEYNQVGKGAVTFVPGDFVCGPDLLALDVEISLGENNLTINFNPQAEVVNDEENAVQAYASLLPAIMIILAIVLLLGMLTTWYFFRDQFAFDMQTQLGWLLGLFIIMILLVAFAIFFASLGQVTG